MPVPEASVFPTTTAPVNDPVLNFPDIASDVEFGWFDPKGKPKWRAAVADSRPRALRPWVAKAELRRGHRRPLRPRLDDRHREHDRDGKGEPARGKYTTQQGESFFNKKGDPKVVFKLKDGPIDEAP